jgi:ABC-type multidrug transport system fused ATPase/permease subunit
MNELDSKAHTRAMDSLLNYETVKYFNNEGFETRATTNRWNLLRQASLKSADHAVAAEHRAADHHRVGLIAMLWRATEGVVEGRMTVGDLVMVNAFMIQLYIPLNFLGVIYREIKQSLTDLDKMFTLIERDREVADAPDARPLLLKGPAPSVRFDQVQFAYDPSRPILHDLSFEIPAGQTVAVVGPSGSGKSRWRACCTASTTCKVGASPSTATTSAASRRTACAATSASCRRTRCCSTTRWPTTSPTAGPGHARRGDGRRPGRAHPRLHRQHAQGL